MNPTNVNEQSYRQKLRVGLVLDAGDALIAIPFASWMRPIAIRFPEILTMPRVTFKCLRTLVLICAACVCEPDALAKSSRLFFCCGRDNDLFACLKDVSKSRFETPAAAIRGAHKGAAVLLLADDYPVRTVALDAASFELARRKQLRLFIEFASSLPGMETEPINHTTWERIVVASERFSPGLSQLRILATHDCHFIAVSSASNPDLVVARVAGYDKAVFGLPEKDTFPILFEVPESHWFIATTKLSGFRTGRYAPTEDWKELWQRILALLSPDYRGHLVSAPVVRPAFSEDSKLPGAFQR